MLCQAVFYIYLCTKFSRQVIVTNLVDWSQQNNNNNNINDNNVNGVSQDSNNVASTVNVANQIGVTVLPIPGRRRRRSLVSINTCPPS